MKNTIKVATLALSFLALSTYAKYELSFNEELDLQANNLKSIFVDVGAGTLKLRGGDVDNIHVYAKIRSSDYSDLGDLQEAFNSKMQFSLYTKKSQAVLKVLQKNKLSFFNHKNIMVDLEVVIPRNLKVEIDDGSGSMAVSDINNSLYIDDGSGSMSISNIGGHVEIDDGSGSTSINQVDGSIYIDDGSGQITISNVTGDVTVDDGSGSIIIDGLQGRFHMEDDGSGSVRINGKKWTSR